jgi:hypothetical protein
VGVPLLAAAPAVVGIALWDDWESYHVLPMALIAFGPLTVISLFVALTPFLEGWWLRKRRRRETDNDSSLK